MFLTCSGGSVAGNRGAAGSFIPAGRGLENRKLCLMFVLLLISTSPGGIIYACVALRRATLKKQSHLGGPAKLDGEADKARDDHGRDGRGTHGRDALATERLTASLRTGLLRQTNPIPGRANGGASAVETKSCDRLHAGGGSEKQSQCSGSR